MTTYVALLRAVNVGKTNSLKMADLRELCESLGLSKVKTYIQSGNIIFQSNEEPKTLEKKISEMIFQEFGYEVPSFVFSLQEWKKIIDAHPFCDSEREDKHIYVTLLSQDCTISTFHTNGELYSIVGRGIYFLPNLKGRTTLSNQFFEQKLKVAATTRNWATCKKLHELALSIDA